MSAEATGWVWRHSPWKGHHVKFLLHLAVADVVNDAHDNEFWMSHGSLAEKVGCRRATVSEWFTEAVGLGLVQLVTDNSRAGRPNRYRVVLTAGCTPTGQGCTPTGQGVYASRTGGVRPPDTELKGTKPTQPEPVTSTDAPRAATTTVVAAWAEATGRDPGRVKPNAKRTAAVTARLKEGYTTEDLVMAARGIALSSWHTGDNPEGKKYDDLLVAIRDGERVEKFRDLYLAGGDRPRRSAVDSVLDLLADNQNPHQLEAGGTP